MIAMLSSISTIPSSVPPILLKVTVALAAAGTVALILRRSSAAIRHLVWLLALASCVVLTVAVPVVPRIDIPIRTTGPARSAISRAFPDEARATIARPVAAATSQVIRIGASRMRIVIPAATSNAKEPSGFARVLPFFFAAVWAAGFIVVIARARLGHSRVASIIDDGRRLTSAEWRGSIRDASIDVGLRRDVELFESDEIASPMTSGFLNPVIVLPLEARHWDAERRHVVLVHELAHVARFDYVAQLVATLACAVLWFHPLVWFASARLRAEAEHAADDRVLHAGTVGVRYAEHLLEIARQQSGDLTPAVALGMVRSSRLEGRFRAMLDSKRSRSAVPARVQALATSLTLCAMLPIAGLHPVALRGVPVTRPELAASVSHGFASEVAQRALRARIEAKRAERAASIAIAIAARADSIFEKTLTAYEGEKLILDLQSGGAITIHGWDQPRIRVVGRLAGRDWRDTEVSLERVSGGVRLRSDLVSTREQTSTSHEFEIWAPKHTNVQLTSAGGSLAINDLDGEFRGHSGGGGITIENATGSARLSTGGGGIAIANSRLSGTVTTGGGELTVTNVTGGLRGTSGTGSTIVSNADGISTVRGRADYGATTSGGFGGSTSISTTEIGSGTNVIAGSARGGFGRGIATSYSSGTLAISKDGGEIVIDRAPEGAVLQTGGGRIVVGSSDRSVTVNTGGGDIELENVAGDATASTGSGDVRISIVNTRRSDHTIDVQSGRGRIVIEVPASLDARIELESAYTDNFNRTTSISSDFALEQSETDRWDSSAGTPRKYVRAVGVVGNGRGLIRVHTVNGDVVLKRVNR